MQFGFSTYYFSHQRLNSHILEQVHSSGLRHIEIFADRQHLDYRDSNHLRDVALWLGDHQMTLHSLHAPLTADAARGREGGVPVSTAYLEKRRRIDSMDELKRVLEMAERLRFDYLVLHLGLADEEYDLSKFDAAFSTLEHLKIFAKERGVQLLLENTPNALSTPERLVEFIQYTRLDLKICFDAGHAHLAGGFHAAFEVLKDRIATVHLHDNHGDKDEHLVPYEGAINWFEAARDLKSLDQSVPLIFELQGQAAQTLDHGALRKAMDKLEAGA